MEENKKKNKIGKMGYLIAGSLITGYILIGSLGEWKPWNYGKFFNGHRQINTNYERLFEGCKNKNDSIDLYQKFELQDCVKLKEPSIDEKIRVLSESKSIEKILRD